MSEHPRWTQDEIRAALREYRRQRRARLAGKEPRQHGTQSAYRDYRCRCAECRAWNAAEQRRYYQQRIRVRSGRPSLKGLLREALAEMERMPSLLPPDPNLIQRIRARLNHEKITTNEAGAMKTEEISE